MNEWFVIDELERALCSRVVAAKGEVVEKGHTVEQAKYGRDALAKVRTKARLPPTRNARYEFTQFTNLRKLQPIGTEPAEL